MGTKENQSKMYISRSDGSTLREVYPVDTRKVLPSNEVALAWDRIDVRGIYFAENGVGGRWGYFFTEVATNRTFDIVTRGWEEESFSYPYEARLTEEVEEMCIRDRC